MTLLALAGHQIDWTDVTIGLVIVGVPSIVILFFIVRRAIRVRQSGENPLRRKGTICPAASRVDAMEYVVLAIRSSGGTIVSKDEEKGQVLAKYGMTRRTWGQYLQIDLWDTDLGEQQCVCTSWPTQDLVFTEWGAGNITIEQFLGRLTEISPQGAVLGPLSMGHTLNS
jgi:hypothetical protein